MTLSRRKLLSGVALVGGIGLGGYALSRESCEIACFKFDHEGFDDAPSWITISHDEGRNLPANEVCITGKDEGSGEYRTINTASSEVGGVMKPWYKLADRAGPNDGVADAQISRTAFEPDASSSSDSFEVLVVWKRDGEIIELDSWLRTWQGYEG